MLLFELLHNFVIGVGHIGNCSYADFHFFPGFLSQYESTTCLHFLSARGKSGARERSERKNFFDPPPFSTWGGQAIEGNIIYNLLVILFDLCTCEPYVGLCLDLMTQRSCSYTPRPIM